MSLTETTTMTTTAVYNADKTHRYLLRKEWDSNLPEAMIIILDLSFLYFIKRIGHTIVRVKIFLSAHKTSTDAFAHQDYSYKVKNIPLYSALDKLLEIAYNYFG